MSSGEVFVAESIRGTGEDSSAGSIKERDGMRGVVGRRRLVRTGAAPPCAVNGVAGDRTRAGRPSSVRGALTNFDDMSLGLWHRLLCLPYTTTHKHGPS